jgi:hypothetical protein
MLYRPPPAPIATAVRHVTGQYLAKNKLSKRGRAQLAADIIAGRVTITQPHHQARRRAVPRLGPVRHRGSEQGTSARLRRAARSRMASRRFRSADPIHPPRRPRAGLRRAHGGDRLTWEDPMKNSPQVFDGDNWRQLPLDALAAAILQGQRSAVRKHLSEREWRRLDRMRKRLAELRKKNSDAPLRQKLAGHDPGQP